ncbi:MAG TPA: ABC transporter permease [Candidatus Eisenbacteria bacterium]|nr:ABC transporter permease [Candidatus Eisenbacteria bacterium]
MTRRFWSNVLAVAYKETRVLRNDPAVMAMMLIQPVIMVLLFGGALSYKPRNVPWAVLDRDGTALSRRFVESVGRTEYFLPPQPVYSYREGERLLGRGSVLAFVVVPETFERDAARGQARVQLLLDGSEPLSAARIGGVVSAIASAFRADTATRPVRAGPIDVRQRFRFNPTLTDRLFYLAALAGILLTNLCMSGTSLGLVGERENGTYEQMLSLPTSSIEIVLGKLLPIVVICYVVLALATVLAGVIFGFWPRGSFLLLCVVALPFVLASLAIGVLVSTLAHTSAQAVFITVFFIMPSFVLSGIMLPYALMPHPIREIGGLLPLRWFQIASRRIVGRGTGIIDVLVPTAILVLIFAVLLALIRWRMKPRLG